MEETDYGNSVFWSLLCLGQERWRSAEPCRYLRLQIYIALELMYPIKYFFPIVATGLIKPSCAFRGSESMWLDLLRFIQNILPLQKWWSPLSPQLENWDDEWVSSWKMFFPRRKCNICRHGFQAAKPAFSSTCFVLPHIKVGMYFHWFLGVVFIIFAQIGVFWGISFCLSPVISGSRRRNDTFRTFFPLHQSCRKSWSSSSVLRVVDVCKSGQRKWVLHVHIFLEVKLRLMHQLTSRFAHSESDELPVVFSSRVKKICCIPEFVFCFVVAKISSIYFA